MQPRAGPRWLRACTAAAALSCVTIPAAGQIAPTCGWSFIDTPAVPPTLQSLRSRAQEVPEWLAEAEQQLLRWYRDCDETAARTAARSLQAFRGRTNSSDPLLLAWLGLALVRGPEVQVPRAEGAFLRSTHRSSNAERDGARLLARVAESNDWLEVAEELAAVAVATRKDETLQLASRTLWNVAEARDEPALWSALAEVELVRAEHDAAERASGRAVMAGEPRGIRVAGILELRSGNDSYGADVYLYGLGLAQEEKDVQPFFDDLRMVLGEDERVQWHTLEDGRADWIRRKWEWRAQMSGVRLAERLGVNERRLEEAARRYNRSSFRGAQGEYPVWSYETGMWRLPLDDRGVIFLRHGEPTTVVDDPIAGPESRGARIAWIYGGPTSKPMALEFVKPGNRADYYMAEPTPCYPRASSRPQRAQAPSGYAVSLATHDPALGWYYIRCAWSPDVGISGYADARASARRDAQAAWSSESGVVRFRQPLTTTWNLYAFQTATGPELVNFLSVDTNDLQTPEAGPARLDFDVLFSVGDPVNETSTQLDTILRYASTTPLPRNAALQWALPIRTPANDNARVTVTVRNLADPAQGRVASTTWRVPAFDGPLLLSDLIVGEPRTGVLRRGTHAIAPARGHALLEDSPFRLYYELYGALSGDPLSVTIQVLPGKDESLLAKLQSLISSRNAFSLEFEDEAGPDPDGAMRVERDFQADLEPGAYVMVVAVRNGRTGEMATTDTNLVVVKR